MSSYLLAFVAGDLQGVTARQNGYPRRCLFKPAHPLSTLFLTGYRCPSVYEDYYGIEMPILNLPHRPS